MTPIDRRALLLGTGGLVVLAGCSATSSSPGGGGAAGGAKGPLLISAIPDQDPAKLNQIYPAVATLLATAVGIPVIYKAVTDYPAVVRGFQIGDIGLAWMGGLTGVQARVRLPGAQAIVQRNIDAAFHSLFIANQASGLTPFATEVGLKSLAGHSFTFGSQTSTSGRLMPEFYMKDSGLDLTKLKGAPGFSGSHDATIEEVASGSFEVGAVNEQVWTSTQKTGKVDLSKVVVLWRTPGFTDYHWLARPDLDRNFGAGTTKKITDAFLALTPSKPEDAKILDLFGCTSFVPTKNSNYDQLEKVAKDLGLLT